MAEQRGRPILTAVILGNVAGAQLKLGNPTKALEQAKKAITMLRENGGSKHWESMFLYYQAEAERTLGFIDEALVSYRRAIEGIEQSRSLSIATEISRAG